MKVAIRTRGWGVYSYPYPKRTRTRIRIRTRTRTLAYKSEYVPVSVCIRGTRIWARIQVQIQARIRIRVQCKNAVFSNFILFLTPSTHSFFQKEFHLLIRLTL